jgi:Na+-transporting NADH:ubiquinone oxidoreductase subunit NqrF
MSLVLASGMLTGIPSSLSVVIFFSYKKTPVDHTRILMQVQKSNDHKYHGSIDAGVKIYKKYGIKGLYLGFCPTLLR